MTGRLFIISAPAGTGKTTLVDRLKKEYPHQLTQSISCTTRSPRQGEVDGKDYVFLTKKAFEERIKRGDFLEHAHVFGEYYGTLKEMVRREQSKGKDVILVIDTQGALELKKTVAVTTIFMIPPSMEVLEERLKSRETETPAALKKRLEWALHEMEQAKHYDYNIINDDLEKAYETLKKIIIYKR